MLKKVIGGVALVLAVSAFASQASALPLISPASGSDQILSARFLAARFLAARPPSTSNDLVFTYTKTVTSKGKPVSTETGTVTLGADFTAIDQASDHTLDDFTLCRVLTWKTGKSELDNQSCFFWPAFRLSEFYNRQAMNRLLTGASNDKTKLPENVIPYWVEQELAVQDKPSDPLTTHIDATATDYSLNDRVVVRTSLAGSTFTPDEHQRIARFLARHSDLHPQILRAILASGQLPSDMTIERYHADQPETEALHFTALLRQAGDYPLPPHLTSSMVAEAKGDSIEARGLNQVLAALNGTAQPPKPDFDTLMGRLEAAVTAKQGLAATFLFQELASQYGGSIRTDPARMTRLRAVVPSLQVLLAQPDNAPFMSAANLAGGGGKPTSQNEDAARYLANAKTLDALPFGTFRYVTFANLVRVSGDTRAWDKAIFSAMPPLADCYWTHIAAYPWASNAYKDLGDLAYQGFDMDKAWQAWDLGRAVDPDWQTGTMQSVGKYEDSLRGAMPDNF